jgi:hypothetical protein
MPHPTEGFFSNAVNMTTLRNGARVDTSLVQPIIDALTHLFKTDYRKYTEFVEFCETCVSSSPGKIFELSDLGEWIDLPAHENMQFDDVINVVLASVDNDMVLRSPFPSEERQMFPKRR